MIKKLWCLGYILVCNFICFSHIYAAPSINSVVGTVSSGQTITITGLNFGTKATAAPLLWDNFESVVPGQVITGKLPVVGSAWTTYTSGSTVPVYDSAINKTGSTRSSRADYYLKPDYDVCLTKNVNTTTGSELFFSYYWYYHKRSTRYADNNKPWMVWGPGGLPMAYVGYGDPALGDGSSRYALQDNPYPSNSNLWGSSDLSNLNDKWVRIDVYLKQSAPNTANGVLQYWVNGVLDISKTSAITRTSNSTWDTILLGGFIRQNQPIQIYIDDVYIDNTRARIEIGDAATWTACKRKDIQRSTSWSSNTITAVVNQGSFTSSSGAYLYVIDSNGSVNANGFPISFGQASTPSDITPPAKPSGVTIQIVQ